MEKMSKMTIYIHFLAIFRALKLDYGSTVKLSKFPANALSFIYFPQKNTLESYTSSLVLKI